MLENRMYNVFSLKLDLYISHNVCTSQVTQDHTSIGSKTSLGHSMDPKMDLIIFEKISGFLRKFWLFLFLIFDIVPLILPLSNSTNAQWTSWTFRDPRMDPQMNPARKFPGPLVNKVLAGSNHSLN